MNKKLFYALLAIISLTCLCSCSSTQKIKNSESKKSEASADIKTEETQLVRNDSTISESIDSSYDDTETISITFKDEAAFGQEEEVEEIILDTGTTSPVKKPKVYTYNIDGKEISTVQPIAKIDITNKKTGEKKEVKVLEVNKSDSTAGKTDIKINSSEENSVKQSTVVKKRVPWIPLMIIAVLAFVLFAYGGHIKGFIFWIFRRKRPPAAE